MKILILCDVIHMKFYKRQNYNDRKQMDGCQGQVSGNCKDTQGNYLEVSKSFMPWCDISFAWLHIFLKITWLYTQNWKIVLYIIIPQYKYSKNKNRKDQKIKNRNKHFALFWVRLVEYLPIYFLRNSYWFLLYLVLDFHVLISRLLNKFYILSSLLNWSRSP